MIYSWRRNLVLAGLIAAFLWLLASAWLSPDNGPQDPLSSLTDSRPTGEPAGQAQAAAQLNPGSESIDGPTDEASTGESSLIARSNQSTTTTTTPYSWEEASSEASAELIYANDFDRDFELWQGDKNVWQMGAPVAGPENLCADDSMCIGTVLDAKYPDFVDASLQSPPIDLPQLELDETIELNASNWFDIDINDRARILVSYFDGEYWLEPEVLFAQGGNSSAWRPLRLNLSKYAGKKVRLHFLLEQHEKLEGVGNGWYIDNLQLIKKPAS